MHIVNISWRKFVIFIELKLKLNTKWKFIFLWPNFVIVLGFHGLHVSLPFSIDYWWPWLLDCIQGGRERKREVITHGNYLSNLNISYRYVIFGKIEKLLHFWGNWENLSTHFSQLPLNVNLNQLKCQLQQNMKT